MRKFITFGPALVVLLTALVTLFAAPAAVRYIGYANTDASVRLARQTLEQNSILQQIDRAVRAVADSVEPSVVHIGVEEAGRGRYVRTAQGSGWVYDSTGHLVTNAHVVRNASRIVVQFQDGRAVQADLVGLDPTTDVAVIKVSATEGLVPAQRATALELHQGERVYAFGSPFGFKFSMSEGIVSGLGRDPREAQPEGIDPSTTGMFTNYIQTDAAVNPGNSGGPLVNVDGKVVGMNVSIATARDPNAQDQGQSSGISFAIPLPTIESVVDQLIKTGVVSKGFLGINHQQSDAKNEAELERLNYRGRGIFVTLVPPDGPAGKAGLLASDIITKINGTVIGNLASLRSSIANNQPGDTVKVEVWREGELKTLSVTLGTLPPSAIEFKEVERVLINYGLTRLADTDKGVEIVSMMRPSAAYRAGLLPEMRVTAVEGAKVASKEELFKTLAERGLHQGRDVTVTVDPGRASPMDVKINSR